MPEKDRNSCMAFIKSYYRIIHFAFFSIDAPKYGEKDIHQVASTTYKSKVYVNNYLEKPYSWKISESKLPISFYYY